MRTREERMAAFIKASQHEITFEEATRMIKEEGLDDFKRIEINTTSISDNCAIINQKTDGKYSLIITDEKGTIVREITTPTSNNAYYRLVEELRSIKNSNT